jgi:hypothetical protein
MGVGVQLLDERGGMLDSVADPKNLLGHLLPDDEVSHPMLASIWRSVRWLQQ